MKQFWCKGFCEDISNLCKSVYVFELDNALCCEVTQVVIFNQNMFTAFVVDRVLGLSDTSCIVLVDGGG